MNHEPSEILFITSDLVSGILLQQKTDEGMVSAFLELSV
jgi:hypothetical protein